MSGSGTGTPPTRTTAEGSAEAQMSMPENLESLPTKDVGAFIERFAHAHNVSWERTRFDDWTEAVSRVAGDDIRLDRVERLLVAVKRLGLISGRQAARLLTNYMMEKKITQRPNSAAESKSMSAVPPQPARLRIQVASDLHLEFIRRRFHAERVIKPQPDADLLVLAGDIDSGLGILDAFCGWPVPILYVIGNHESYGRVYDDDRATLRAACADTTVVLLDQDVVTASDLAARFPAWASSRAVALPMVRFVGCTLWTGYRYSACGKSHEAQMDVSERGLNDHRLIRLSTGPFDAQAALACHEADSAWLRSELARPFDGDTFVITHHAPSERSVHPRFQGDPLTGAFATDLPELLAHAQVWVHGHHHDSSDYVERGCRVVCNPSGYPIDLNSVRLPEELHFENTEFDNRLIIQLPVDRSSSVPDRNS